MKKIINFLIDLKFIFMPTFWLMNYPYSKEIDDELNNLMDNHEPVLGMINSLSSEYYDVSFGETRVWIQNYPYAYGRIIVPNTICYTKYGRPSRQTIIRLKNLLSDKLNLRADGTAR